MDDKSWSGFVIGCALGFDLDTEEVEAILKNARLDPAVNSLTACQYAIKDHVGEYAWKRGIAAIRDAAGF